LIRQNLSLLLYLLGTVDIVYIEDPLQNLSYFERISMTFSPNLVETQESPISETQAITRLKQGNLNGLEVLVNHYQVKAVHAAILILHDRMLAEEIVQSSFVRVAQKIHQFDDHRPFGPWFLRIVINAAIQEANRQRRLSPLEPPMDEETGGAAEWLADPGLCPEELAENEALYRAVWQALDQLPPYQRAAIVLRYFEDCSEAEITRTLQRPLTTVKWWLHAARKRLRRILQREYDSESESSEGDQP
jgi:RNA polymerase sigma-70 factor (ECF subfamily)